MVKQLINLTYKKICNNDFRDFFLADSKTYVMSQVFGTGISNILKILFLDQMWSSVFET